MSQPITQHIARKENSMVVPEVFQIAHQGETSHFFWVKYSTPTLIMITLEREESSDDMDWAA